MEKRADLHMHSSCSDGTQTPEEVVIASKDVGMSCIAISDHDTIDAIKPAIACGKEHGVEVIPAIELSTEIDKKDVHMLGYLFDYENAEFLEVINKIQYSRIGRMHDMIAKLKEAGVDDISFEDVEEFAGTKSLGRPHLAHFLEARGWVKNKQEAFDKYLADGRPGCVPKFKISPFEAIEMVEKAGGISVLAHPKFSQVDEHIPAFVEAGLGGIEVYYPNTPRELIRFYEGLVEKHGLVATGGSDAHGDNKKHTYIGKVSVPYELVEKLKSYHKSKFSAV